MIISEFWQKEIVSFLERGFILRANGNTLYVYDKKGKLVMTNEGVFRPE